MYAYLFVLLCFYSIKICNQGLLLAPDYFYTGVLLLLQSLSTLKKKKKKICRPLAPHPPAACRASCPGEGGDGADGWEDERKDKKASGKIREWGTARVSTVRREVNITNFLSG